MPEPDPHYVLIGGTVWIAPERDAELSQCTARTKAGKRCRRTLENGQISGWSSLPVEGGYVTGYDLDGRNGELTDLGRRWLQQRCEQHYGNETPGTVEPEWQQLDPATLTFPASPLAAWEAMSATERSYVRHIAPDLCAALEAAEAAG